MLTTDVSGTKYPASDNSKAWPLSPAKRIVIVFAIMAQDG